jgi:hypothetical protein
MKHWENIITEKLYAIDARGKEILDMILTSQLRKYKLYIVSMEDIIKVMKK